MLKHGRALSEVFFVIAPKSLAALLLFASNLLLYRLLTPSEFGIYSLCLTALLLLDGTLGVAFDMAVVRVASGCQRSDPSYASVVERTGVYAKLLIGAMVAVSLSLAAAPLSERLFAEPGRQAVLYATSTALIGLLVLRSVLVHLQLRGLFLEYGKTDFIHTALKFGGMAAAVLWWASAEVALSWFLIGALVAVGYGARHKTYALFAWPGRAGRRALADLSRYVKWILATAVFGNLIAKMDVFFLGFAVGMGQLGVFSSAKVIATLPELFGAYIAVVLSPKIVPVAEAGRFRELLLRVQLIMFAVAAVLLGIAYYGYVKFAPWLFPPGYEAAAQLLPVLFVGALAGMTTIPIALSFVLFADPKLIFKIDLFLAPSLLIIYYLVTQRYGMVGAAWVTAGSTLLRSAIVQLMAWRWSRSAQRLLQANQQINAPFAT